MSDSVVALVWFERDLRVDDNRALSRACDKADTVVPLFVDDIPDDGWARSRRQSIWLRRSLEALDAALRETGLRLTIRSGDSAGVLRMLVDETGADVVVWNRRYRPAFRRRDKKVIDELRDCGVEVTTTAGRILHNPDEVQTTTGGPYHVYTPFWRKFRKVVDVDAPQGKPPLWPGLAPDEWPESEGLEAITEDAEATWLDFWTPGEQAAQKKLKRFAESGIGDYDELRDRPDQDGTSRLSPHLHFGELSPRRVWHRARDFEGFRRQVVWREFSYHLLHHYPETADEPLRDKFRDFRWRVDAEAFERWQQGKTGYPIVDAGMRQLHKTGWMHNRVRMIAASFLTKDLLIPWQEGARWFWSNLVDADLANNTMGWQWSAGCGADAQPFFRVFNPVKQGRRHDPEGEYVRRFVPELQRLESPDIHAPWEASKERLQAANLNLGSDYPRPIVDHGRARKVALDRYDEIK